MLRQLFRLSVIMGRLALAIHASVTIILYDGSSAAFLGGDWNVVALSNINVFLRTGLMAVQRLL